MLPLFFGVAMKLKFHQDVYINGELFASAGEVKDVPEQGGSAQRWIVRGAQVVEDEPVSDAPGSIADEVDSGEKVEIPVSQAKPKRGRPGKKKEAKPDAKQPGDSNGEDAPEVDSNKAPL